MAAVSASAQVLINIELILSSTCVDAGDQEAANEAVMEAELSGLTL